MVVPGTTALGESIWRSSFSMQSRPTCAEVLVHGGQRRPEGIRLAHVVEADHADVGRAPTGRSRAGRASRRAPSGRSRRRRRCTSGPRPARSPCPVAGLGASSRRTRPAAPARRPPRGSRARMPCGARPRTTTPARRRARPCGGRGRAGAGWPAGRPRSGRCRPPCSGRRRRSRRSRRAARWAAVTSSGRACAPP